MPFPENLRRLRLERFWSQEELAKRAGFSQVTIARYENAVTAPLGRSVRALAAALGVEPQELAMPEETAEYRARGKVAAAA